MSKKQRDQLYVEVIRHQNVQQQQSVTHANHQNQQNLVQAQAQQQAAEAHYLAQYANITPIPYMQHGYQNLNIRNRKRSYSMTIYILY